MVEVFSGDIVTFGIIVTIDGNGRLCLTIRFNQHLAVLSQHILTFIYYPVGVVVNRLGAGNVSIGSLFISVIVPLPFVIITFAVLDADIEIAFIVFVGTIHISDITTTKDVTVLTFQLLRCTYRTTMYVYLCLSENITIGVERTTFTKVVIASLLS